MGPGAALSPPGPSARRRALKALAALAGAPWAAGCTRRNAPPLAGGWVGPDPQRAHRPRAARPATADAAPGTRRVTVAIVGCGIAGLAAARALQQAGVDDYRIFELDDQAGGNSRGHQLRGLACPLGAHYLPTPGPHAHEVAELLEALGVSRQQFGRTVYDERYLCHSPQERLFIDGHWQEGLLPMAGQPAAAIAQYRRLEALVAQATRDAGFAIPTARAAWNPALQALDAQTFSAWLDRHGLDAAPLRWYLDYCCRDEYGAGIAQVSAWAGLHYFGSRHGFHAPGSDADERDQVLTWPEGNGWLVERLLAPHRDRLASGRLVQRVQPGRHEVTIDVQAAGGSPERWGARHVVLAVPLFVAARLVDPLPGALHEAAAGMSYAPWLVTNLWLDRPPLDRIGPAPAWDNVLYGSAGLGYVDAGHQQLGQAPGPRVFTHYWALGGGDAAEVAARRRHLLERPWQDWAEAVIDDLSPAHPDLRERVHHVALARYGHAMSIPRPGLRGSPALAALQRPLGRLHLAHADLSGYSVFEEAWHWGAQAGRDVVHALRG